MDGDILSSIDPQTLGNELKRARKQSRLRQEDVAQIIGVARTTITAIENGERRIRAEELVKLARAYERSISDFLRARPAIPAFTSVQFRAPVTQTSQEQEEINISISIMEDLCRDYLELEGIVGQPLVRTYPSEYQRSGTSLEAEAEALAQSERNRLGLGDGPISLLRDILEQDVGLRIFYVPLRRTKLSAIYYYSDKLGGCIVVNSDHKEDRRRMSLSHDYCHFLSDRRKPTIAYENTYQRVPESERFADAFARYFLMPTNNVVQRFNDIKRQGPIKTRDLLSLANRYGVSLDAMVLRLEDLRLLKAGALDKIKGSNFKIREAQQELGLEEIPGRRDMFPLHYRRLAVEAFQQGHISEGRLARYLRVDRMVAREIAGEATDE